MRENLLIQVAMASALAIAISPCFGQQLWRGTSKGMTLDQVRNTVSGVETVSAPENMKGGSLGLLRVPNVVIGHTQFAATFYFLSGILDEVQLERIEPMSAYQASLNFDELSAALTGKYGSSVAQKEQPSSLMTVRSVEWMSGRTNIQLLLMVIGNDDPDPVLSVTYQTRLATEGDNL